MQKLLRKYEKTLKKRTPFFRPNSKIRNYSDALDIGIGSGSKQNSNLVFILNKQLTSAQENIQY